MEFRKSTVREYFESIVITAIIALFATTFVIQAFKIPTGSMESNLLIGDHLLVNKFIYGLHSGFWSKSLPYHDPKRGDVIVFKYPNSPEVAYVKRLIGTPGDKVEMIGRTIYINGKALKENYTQYIEPGSIYEHYGPFSVPRKGMRLTLNSETFQNLQPFWKEAIQREGHTAEIEDGKLLIDGRKATSYVFQTDHFFAMGDNRDNSQDSRYWGFVPRDYILGKALVIYWSFETPRDEYLQTSVPDRAKQFADVFLNFITKTRWRRTFRIIR